MCVYFSIGFIDFMFEGKILLQYTTLFSANEYKRNDKTILKHFLHLNKLKCILLFSINIENLKKTKASYIFKKTLSISIVYSKRGHKYEEILKDKE